MAISIHMDKFPVGEGDDRVILGLEDIKKIEVDLEKNTAKATLSNDEVIPMKPEEAVLFIHYNNIWRSI